MMDKEAFFEKVKQNCNTETEKCIALLRARGFFINEVNGKYKLSDNGDKDDPVFLREVLEKNNSGTVTENGVIEFAEPSATYLQDELLTYRTPYPVSQGINALTQTYKSYWVYAQQRIHGIKVGVRELEPFISAFVKSLSACGVCLAGSCDGNPEFHGRPRNPLKRYSLWLQISTYADAVLLDFLLNHIIPIEYRMVWDIQFDERLNAFAPFRRSSTYDVYYKVLQASSFLYEHRKEIRALKHTAFGMLTKEQIKHLKDDELKEMMIGNLVLCKKECKAYEQL